MRVHFVGIGGIGVSALAQYYLAKGHEVSGSDLASSEITEALKRKGIKIFIGKEKIENISKKFDLIIHSPAVNVRRPTSNILSYPQALGELTKQHFTIAVSGTHGKSTTTAMLGLLLTKAGLDPTVIVGTKLKEFGNSIHSTNSGLTLSYVEGSNCRVGKSKYLVIEADEHFASFLNYWPKIIVLTNIERDHLDYYKNLSNLVRAFKEYVSHLPKEGLLIANQDDKIISTTFLTIVRKVVNYSLTPYSLAQPEAKKLREMLRVPGEHNVSNALAALAVARTLKIPDKISLKALSQFRGTWRRFDVSRVKLQGKSITLVSDYGHHPTEISATLKAAREKWPKKQIWCVFQPHQYQRTYYLFNDFVKSFRKAPVNQIIIIDIYDVAGREDADIKKRVSAEKLVKAVGRKKVIYLAKNQIIDYLKKHFPKNQILIIMGAGDIYALTKELDKGKIKVEKS